MKKLASVLRRVRLVPRRRLRIVPPMTPEERAHLMFLSARLGLLLGLFLGAALLAWWFG
jgi:hypothetical protein